MMATILTPSNKMTKDDFLLRMGIAMYGNRKPACPTPMYRPSEREKKDREKLQD